jgi:hypothetical protein
MKKVWRGSPSSIYPPIFYDAPALSYWFSHTRLLALTYTPVFPFAHFLCMESATSHELFFNRGDFFGPLLQSHSPLSTLIQSIDCYWSGKKFLFLASILPTRNRDRMVSSGQSYNVEHWTIGAFDGIPSWPRVKRSLLRNAKYRTSFKNRPQYRQPESLYSRDRFPRSQSEVGKMTTFDFWLIPWGGREGMGCRDKYVTSWDPS